jgi:hypothetical protein
MHSQGKMIVAPITALDPGAVRMKHYTLVLAFSDALVSYTVLSFAVTASTKKEVGFSLERWNYRMTCLFHFPVPQ